MSEQSRNTLKSYFLTGSIPSQSNFGDLIDSCVNETDDEVYVDSYHNTGFGLTLPPARLAIANTGKKVIPTVTLTLLNGNATARATVSEGVSLSTIIYPGDRIEVTGILSTFSVISVSATSLQLFPLPAADVSNVQVTLLKNLFFIGSTNPISDSATQLVVTNEGRMGLGRLQPQQALDVNGNIQAGGFIGNGSQLTDLIAGNITGKIPIATLPSISFGNIEGQLTVSQLPSGYQPAFNGIVSFNCSEAIIQAGNSVTLSWEVNGVDSVELSFLDTYTATTINSANEQSWLPKGTFTVYPDFNQTYTIRALKDNVVLGTAQITITVIPNVRLFIQSCVNNKLTPVKAVSSAGQLFGLSILCASNVSLLTAAMKGVYSNSEIFQAIPAYYISLNYQWSPLTNGPWIIKILESAINS